jgi:hypothetical protein
LMLYLEIIEDGRDGCILAVAPCRDFKTHIAWLLDPVSHTGSFPNLPPVVPAVASIAHLF